VANVVAITNLLALVVYFLPFIVGWRWKSCISGRDRADSLL
jgi:hypothetical protein